MTRFLLVFAVLLVGLLAAELTPPLQRAVVVPSVAELPTRHEMPHAEPPLMTLTDAPAAVVSVLPILNTKAALGSPPASRTRAPVSCADELKQ